MQYTQCLNVPNSLKIKFIFEDHKLADSFGETLLQQTKQNKLRGLVRQ
jgi:hypothetical protein